MLFFCSFDVMFVCPTEVVDFCDKLNEFHNVNYDVATVLVGFHFSHLAWINTPRKSGNLSHISITLLLYLIKEVTYNDRVLLEGAVVVLRNFFMIDLNGVIKHLSVNGKPLGHSMEEIFHLEKGSSL